MRYFKLSSRTFGQALLTRRDTTMHFFKLGRLAIVWDYPERPADD